MKTFKLKLIGIFAVAALIAVGCSAPVHVEKDDNVDFSQYRSYAWVEADGARTNRSNSLMEQKFKTAVSKELDKQGWKMDSRRPDVLISYDVLVERSQREQNDPVYSRPYTRTFYNPYSRRYYSVYYPSEFIGYDNYSVPVREGTVTITVTDANTDKVVWQGWTTDEVNSRSLSSKEISSSVKSIFKKFNSVAKR
jgi:hypothetical protein